MAKERIRNVVRYTGHVQGVGFRMTSVSAARGLSVHGFVRNEPDGSVLLDVEGSSADVKELLSRISMAMSGKIDHADSQARDPKNQNGGLKIQY